MSPQILNAVTYTSRHPHSLLGVLPQALQRIHSPLPDQALLFAIAPSSTTSPEVLSNITSTLTQLCPQHVGCIAAPLPHQYLDSRIHRGPDSCSLSLAFVNGVSFRSTVPGRTQAQVGRWHAARRRSATDKLVTDDIPPQIPSAPSGLDGRIDWDKVWEHSAKAKTFSSSLSFDTGPGIKSLPDTLRDVDPSAVENILYFSDKSPEGIGSVLEGVFPQANKLALIASSTPFLTGRPVTLFRNGSILSDGAVGVAFTRCTSPPSVQLSLPPLVALSPRLKVTSSEGNLILSLDSRNPTRLLLDAIQKYGLSSSNTAWMGKEDEFYVGIIDPSNHEISQLHRITSGDPSRGSIALDTDSAPGKDTVVCLYRRSQSLSHNTSTYLPDSSHSSLSLLVAPEVHPGKRSTPTEEIDRLSDDLSVIPNAFLVASENGFTLSRLEGRHSTQGPWKCIVPGGRAGLLWK